MLRNFWDYALTVHPDAPDEARVLRFGAEGEMTELLDAEGFQDVTETTLTLPSTNTDFDELWSGFLLGTGPAAAYCLSLPEPDRTTLRAAMYEGLGSPAGPFTLEAVARCATGRAPS